METSVFMNTCPKCKMQNPNIIANDGGSLMCRNCGMYHICKDGQATFSGYSPLDCPRCRAFTFPQGTVDPKSTFTFPPRQVPPVLPQPIKPGRFFCDGCNIPLDNMRQGQHFHCQECPNFDLCSNCVINYPHNNLHHFVDYFSSSIRPICGGWGENSR